MAKVSLDKSIELSEDFTDWVCRRLRRKGETQGKLAKYIGISQQTLSNRISEKTEWKLREYIAAQEYYGERFEYKKEEKKDEND